MRRLFGLTDRLIQTQPNRSRVGWCFVIAGFGLAAIGGTTGAIAGVIGLYFVMTEPV